MAEKDPVPGEAIGLDPGMLRHRVTVAASFALK